MNGNASAIVTSPLTSPSSFRTRRDADDGDIASVSTETEDDPVNLAMRATLGGSSTDQEEQGRVDDEDEVIVWDKG
jgi:protein SMG7